MRIGFTGTQRGMSAAQQAALKAMLADIRATVLHHGDCIGADAQAHELAVAMSCEIVIYSPIIEALRAWKHAGQVRTPKSYLSRNKDCRSASKLDPPSARDSAKPSGATLRCAPPALALRPHNLEGGQLFDADPGQMFGAV